MRVVVGRNLDQAREFCRDSGFRYDPRSSRRDTVVVGGPLSLDGTRIDEVHILPGAADRPNWPQIFTLLIHLDRKSPERAKWKWHR